MYSSTHPVRCWIYFRHIFQIVEQKEVFERRFNYRKDTRKINVSSYRKETRRETTVFVPSSDKASLFIWPNFIKFSQISDLTISYLILSYHIWHIYYLFLSYLIRRGAASNVGPLPPSTDLPQTGVQPQAKRSSFQHLTSSIWRSIEGFPLLRIPKQESDREQKGRPCSI